MKVTQKKIIKNKIAMIVAISIGFFLITAYMVLSDINHTNKTVKRFDYFVRNQMKEVARNEVLDRIDEIEYDLSILRKEQNKIIKNKIEIIGQILEGSNLVKIENIQDRTNETVKVFERIVESDKEYLYFMLSSDGKVLRSGIDNRTQGENFIDVKDKDGIYFIREMLKAVNQPEGVYVTYDWQKEKDGKPLKKTSFCLYIPELDIIIGTGNYDVDIEEELRQATFSRIQSYYKDSEDYIFIVGYDGIAHVFGDPNLQGVNVKSITDSKGQCIHDLFMETLKTNKEGYVNYSYYRKNSNEISEKVSFVKAIDRWGAYIAMGFHIDDFNKELEIYVDELNKEYFTELIITIICLFCIALIILYFVRRSLLLQSEHIRQEESVFEQLFKLSSQGILIISNKGDIMFKNTIIDKMVGANLNEYIDVKGELNLNRISEEVYWVQNHLGRTYYIEWNCKRIIYHGVDSYIYFISNITNKFLKSNKLERMALCDELTTLPNRRKLLNDFEDMVENNTQQHSAVLAMIDLDHFKSVNDQYGHNVGDEVLKLLGECFNNRLRDGDNIYRYGGEEFIVLLKNTTLEDAQAVLMSICNTFSKWNEKKFGFALTFSGGAIKIDSDLDRSTYLQNLLNEADMLLYQAKNKGRSRIEIHLEKDRE